MSRTVTALVIATAAVVLVIVAWGHAQENGERDHCQVTIEPGADGGCFVSWCHYFEGRVADSQVNLACGGQVDICGDPFVCDCAACDAGVASVDTDAGRQVSTHVRFANDRQTSDSVYVSYDGGHCSVVFNRYVNGCWLGLLEQQSPLWCHSSIDNDIYPGCGETAFACGERFQCDCIPGGDRRPGT